VTLALGVAAGLAHGIALGLQFNPVTALVGSVIAAALMGYPGAAESRRPISVGVLAIAWLAGDGVHIGLRVAEAAGGSDPELFTALATWALVGALVGYALPAAAGITVGRRVIRGTGWLSAGAVAGTVAGALALVAPTLAEAFARLVG
jgi:hypothetical protein